MKTEWTQKKDLNISQCPKENEFIKKIRKESSNEYSLHFFFFMNYLARPKSANDSNITVTFPQTPERYSLPICINLGKVNSKKVHKAAH